MVKLSDADTIALRKKNDPTCHGEMEAIRDACKNISSFDLNGADIYTTGQPCVMCLGAILWANISKIYFGCTITENDMIGFRDEIFSETLKINTENLQNKFEQIDHEECLNLFKYYASLKNKTMY